MTYEEEVMEGVEAISVLEIFGHDSLEDLIRRLQELEKANPGSSLLNDPERFGEAGTPTVQPGRIVIPLLLRKQKRNA